MNATDVIATYAAVVSTAGLGWEFWKERRARQPDVRVVLAEGVRWTRDPSSEHAVEEVLLVEVRNFGPYPIRVDSIGFYAGPDHKSPLQVPPVEGELPGIVPSHDYATAWYPKKVLEEASVKHTWLASLAPEQRPVAWIRLATGERIDSETGEPVTPRLMVIKP